MGNWGSIGEHLLNLCEALGPIPIHPARVGVGREDRAALVPFPTKILSKGGSPCSLQLQCHLRHDQGSSYFQGLYSCKT